MTAAGPQITFWQVTDVKQKLDLLCRLVQHHFLQAERVLIAVPNDAAARFVDQLLWTSPPESFIPHAVTEIPLAAAVVITCAPSNLNEAQILINLCPGISPVLEKFRMIHELMDETDSSKQQLSIERQTRYEAMGKTIMIERSQTRLQAGV